MISHGYIPLNIIAYLSQIQNSQSLFPIQSQTRNPMQEEISDELNEETASSPTDAPGSQVMQLNDLEDIGLDELDFLEYLDTPESNPFMGITFTDPGLQNG